MSFHERRQDAADGSIGSVFVSLKMNDGSTYSSAEGEERFAIDDTIMIVSQSWVEHANEYGRQKLTDRTLATLTRATTPARPTTMRRA